MANKPNLKPSSSCCACKCAEHENTAEPVDSSRRNFTKWVAAAVPLLSGLLPVGSALADSEGADPEKLAAMKLPPQPGDLLTYFSKKKRGKILTLDDLKVAKKQLITLPMAPDGTVRSKSRYNQILLQRFEVSSLDKETAELSADGVVAYSAICTHNGCPVSGWKKDDHTYMCPCHQSVFDPKKSAVVVEGPAPRALPALPLKVEDGKIVVAGAFTSWVGFGNKKRV